MVDSLDLPGNEPMGILQKRGCRPRGGAGSLSFYWDRLLWSHCVRTRVRVQQTQKKTGEKVERAAKIHVGGK